MRSRNPFVTALLVIAAVGALVVMFTVGFLLLTALAAVALVLTAGFIVRRKLGLGGAAPTVPRNDGVRARLDPSMEVLPDRKKLPGSESDEAERSKASEKRAQLP